MLVRSFSDRRSPANIVPLSNSTKPTVRLDCARASTSQLSPASAERATKAGSEVVIYRCPAGARRKLRTS